MRLTDTVFEGAEFNREQHTRTRKDLLNSDMEDAIVKLLEEIKDIVERRTPVRE